MSDNQKKLEELRSQRWFAPDTIRAFAHRQRMQQIGLRREEFMGKPVIAILNTWSELSPCHSHLRERAEAVKRGVWAAGGFPVELPVQSVGEVMVKPTTMLYRNLLAMETEELLRSLPIDGAVLLGGCDKSTPGLLMGALSMDLPMLYCPAGPMSNGQWRGVKTGAGTHTKKYWDERRLGLIDTVAWEELEGAMTRSIGTCNTVGTASTMTSIADAIGFTLPGASSIPAADAAHPRMASQCGETIVDLVWRDRRPSTWLTPAHFANGVAVYMAMGGSTNAAIHLIAMARRAGIELTLEQMAETAAKIPVLLNLFPSGNALMEDYHFAGGLRALMREIAPFLSLDCAGATGQTWDTLLAEAKCYDTDIIRPIDDPVVGLEQGSTLALLRGNLCPDGAVMKSSAASPALRKHSGPALVFDDHETLSRMIDDPALVVTADTVLVLRNAGPVGAPGMPEWGNLPIPKKLLEAGVRDMVRISDARMSGTHYGSCVLHVAPEAAVGGPLCLVRTGDIIDLDIAAGTLNMRVSDAELALRRAEHVPVHRQYGRSFAALYQQHVTQANEGCDFDFLQAGEIVPEPPIH
ncbi:MULTISPECIES: 6-deoxy-6-sulfo-D-gluconate dehydratase [unclassified Serratia (in: enterobacteria)]|uniref:6-deoxy-6-sulfo-D-gluconate dehydratase n=1 Tax=unclassified Serratia (in: enterobacteria) TaxID=2647522 RepID=UPI000504C66E|nr:MULTISPECIES: 6-deoxy-6-sulfo-D-gluconate dehydratase [unclassified Serratia (in: enterobacteria)]KFK96221.1 dihydroxy-acid dehydratase [Serratia sp. Ag2]KFL00638.1 dihydroxy-acid dehydratase [Serratia sp. Ag1]